MKKIYKEKLPDFYNEVFKTTVDVEIRKKEIFFNVDVYKPNFGDVVRVTLGGFSEYKRNYFICIYPNKTFRKIQGFFDIAGLDLNGNFFAEEGFSSEFVVSVEPATESEKHELFDKMKEKGLRWNAENKCVEKIKEPFEPKDGDFLIRENEVFIYNGIEGVSKLNSNHKTYGSYLGQISSEEIVLESSHDSWTNANGCRYATEEEKEKFLEILADEHGLMWDEKEKKTKRWRAKKSDTYFCLDEMIKPYECSEDYLEIDDSRYKCGNYFKTKEACERTAEKIKKVLNESMAI